ncbi:MAG: sialidase [Gemmatimonadetes bacterium RBG_16_66_8]|nr:MAG: sialidase [Gemmatimonadetes bacterium RBG_16_66_8]
MPAAAQRGRGQSQAAAQPQVAAELYGSLRYRHIGPVGNRITSVHGVPGNPNTYYVGAASCGVWKTTDAGLNWDPLFDGQIAQSVGSLALAPSNPNVVWVGSGEAHVRSHISIGNGIYKSLDGGKTWTHMGLDTTGRIARVVVHPENPDIVFVCSQGHSYGPQPERGVYRTADAGQTWTMVLHVDQNTGCSDLAMDPTNPNILMAGFWQIEIHTWGRESGGPGSGIFRSADGGITWTRLRGHGLPAKDHGKVALAIARSNPRHLYALIETGDGVPMRGQPTESGELWASMDGGDSWRMVTQDRQMAGRTHYYSRVVVQPDDENESYFLSGSFTKSLDGGRTTVDLGFGSYPGGDNHDMWIDPTNPDRMIVGNDGGVSISTTRGRAWYRLQLPIAQMYHATTDTRVPYFVYGNRQDGPSYRVPSNSRTGGSGGGGGVIPRSEWFSVAGGESGWATPDPENPDIIWSSASGSGSVGGIVTRMDLKTRQARNVEVWPLSTIGWPAADLKYRFVWTAPLTISPNDHNKVYVGSQFVHATTDGGRTWREISPDLTLNDKSRQQISGGLTPDNIGVEYFSVVFSIAESRLKPGLIWAGTNDGLVQVTQDGGRSWTNVTANIPSLPPLGTVSSIEPSRYDTGTAYVAVDFHQVNGRDPHLYKTTDYGRTWRRITNGIPQTPMSYTHVLREDPVRRGLLYAGTENALYVSFSDGELWQPLQANLPHAPVYWLTVQEHFNDLVVSTYGRGFWILDDLTPLQQLTPDVAASSAHLFPPRPAYRFRTVPGQASTSNDPTVGENPQYGASINYWLKTAPSGDVTISIQQADGQTVRTLHGPKTAGLNRVYWDLENEPAKEARMRVPPLYADWFEVGPEGRTAPSTSRLSVLMPPGMYTVKLAVGGQEFSQSLEVRADPNSGGSLEDIGTQVARLRQLQTDLNTTVDMYNQAELIRAQLRELKRTLQANRSAADVQTAADSLEDKATALEENLHQLRTTSRGQDNIRWPVKLLGQIAYLANGMASSDFAPTTQHVQVHEQLQAQIRTLQAQMNQLVRTDIAAFNQLLRQRNIAGVIAAAAEAGVP